MKALPGFQKEKKLRDFFVANLMFYLVAESRCKSYVGKNGIIVQDLKNSFRIATPQNRLLSKLEFWLI